jgi:hypothetical protein
MVPKPENCTKLTQNVPNYHAIFKKPVNNPKGHNIYIHFSIIGPPTFAPNGILV